jgi:uncharacterized protein
MRDSGTAYTKDYDIDKMIAGLEREGQHFTIFGGEPLLVPIEDLEKLWTYGLEKYQRNAIQTNGVLISDQHIELFQKYKVHVGISLDGPDELNDTRWAGTLENTRVSTKKTFDNIDKLIQHGIYPSLIITLHKVNASKEKLPRLKTCLREMDQKGISSVRLHPLEVDHDLVKQALALSIDRNIEIMFEMAELEKELKNLRFDLFADIRKMLIGDDRQVTCTFNACDPYSTGAVRGINSQGESSNCGRTNKDGIDFDKSDSIFHERELALYYTPQEFGGCKDCRFFLMCGGQCPGTGIDSDWRNKTDLCGMYMKLFEYFEQDYISKGILPISQSLFRKKFEQQALINLMNGGYKNLYKMANE